MIKAILFDIDNTLLDFDSYVKQSMKEGFSEFGIGEYTEESYEIFEKINTEFWHRIELGTLTYDELLLTRWNTVFSALGLQGDGVAFEKYFKGRLFNNAIPIKGANEILDHLKGRYILAVASNGPLAQQENRLRIAGMDGYFSKLFVSESIGHSKPSKQFFEHCLRELNVGKDEAILPEEILMIGDSLTSDILGASEFGIATCFFDKRGNNDTGQLSPDYVISELSELKKIL